MEQLVDLLNSLTAFVDSLSTLVTDSPLTYLVIFGMAAIDVVFPLLPAEATVTAAAVLAGQGTLNIAWVVVAAAVGAFIGDNVAYWIGRTAGRPLVVRVLRGNTGQLAAVQAEFDKRGGMFVIIGRFVPGGRTVTAIGAGVLHFPWTRFVVYDAAGGGTLGVPGGAAGLHRRPAGLRSAVAGDGLRLHPLGAAGDRDLALAALAQRGECGGDAGQAGCRGHRRRRSGHRNSFACRRRHRRGTARQLVHLG